MGTSDSCIDKEVRVVRAEGSLLVFLEHIDGDDSCCVTDRICVGSPGSMRWRFVVDEILRGSAFRLVKK